MIEMRTDLGDGIHKVRVAISSKNKGKSGGARIITNTTAILSLEKGVITLLYIYDKSQLLHGLDNMHLDPIPK